MFTRGTKNFGVWKEDRMMQKMSFRIASHQYLFSLSILAFIVFITLIVSVKIRQEFFFIESNPLPLLKNTDISRSFFMKERPAAMSVFVGIDKENNLNFTFDDGFYFAFGGEEEPLIKYLKYRRDNIVYLAMVLRLNSEQNSRVKIYPHAHLKLSDIRASIKIFAQYGFDSFDIGVER